MQMRTGQQMPWCPGAPLGPVDTIRMDCWKIDKSVKIKLGRGHTHFFTFFSLDQEGKKILKDATCKFWGGPL